MVKYTIDAGGEFRREILGTVPQVGAFVVVKDSKGGKEIYKVTHVEHECDGPAPGEGARVCEEQRIVVYAKAG